MWLRNLKFVFWLPLVLWVAIFLYWFWTVPVEELFARSELQRRFAYQQADKQIQDSLRQIHLSWFTPTVSELKKLDQLVVSKETWLACYLELLLMRSKMLGLMLVNSIPFIVLGYRDLKAKQEIARYNLVYLPEVKKLILVYLWVLLLVILGFIFLCPSSLGGNNILLMFMACIGILVLGYKIKLHTQSTKPVTSIQ